jgi:hypothetical protein
MLLTHDLEALRISKCLPIVSSSLVVTMSLLPEYPHCAGSGRALNLHPSLGASIIIFASHAYDPTGRVADTACSKFGGGGVRSLKGCRVWCRGSGVCRVWVSDDGEVQQSRCASAQSWHVHAVCVCVCVCVYVYVYVRESERLY